jgi:subtilisin family serine protease
MLPPRTAPGVARRVTSEVFFGPKVTRLLDHATLADKHALLSLFANDHFEWDPEARRALEGRLESWGYRVQDERPATPDRAERRDWLTQVRDNNVTEPNAQFAKLAALTGAKGPALLAVIDGGFDTKHPLLRPHLRGRRPPGQNLLTPKELAHGTHVTGIGVKGTSLVRALLLPVDLRHPSPDDADTVQSIERAARQGARVVNISLLITGTRNVANVVAAMHRHPEILFVKSAGNNGRELGSPYIPLSAIFMRRAYDLKPEHFLASHSLPNLAVVASSLADGSRDPESNFGLPYATHAMRGEHILSANAGGGLVDGSGTSMAAPDLAGLATRMAVLDPALTPPELLALLTAATREDPRWKDQVAAQGVVNARTAEQLAALTSLLRQKRDPEELQHALHLPRAEYERLLGVASRFVD